MSQTLPRGEESLSGPIGVLAPSAAGPRVDYGRVAMASDLFLLLDPLALFAAALVARPLAGPGQALPLAALAAAALAPFVLHDRRFGAMASRGQARAMVVWFVLRFAVFAAALLALGLASGALEELPRSELLGWFASGLLFTALPRAAVARHLRQLQRDGRLTEVVAVVGAGPMAERLVHALRQTRPETIELLGIFDDSVDADLVHLMELGKKRRIDWIVLTLPPTEPARLAALVHRLKALAVPIGLCPQHLGTALPYQRVGYVGGSVPLSLLAARPHAGGHALRKAVEAVLPRWIVTLALLPFEMAGQIAIRAGEWLRTGPAPARGVEESYQFDDYDVAAFSGVAADFGHARFGYAVTPNADHIIRLHEHASFRSLYAAADFILLDSRFLSHVLQLTQGIQLAVCTGSDLTEKLFADVIAPDDALVLIGGSDAQARQLIARFGLRSLAHHNPPMGFIHDADAVEACLRFVEAHSPFRFCLLAVGSPQQEVIAERLKARGVARGLTLCVGAAIDFLTGHERRAPRWMQRGGIEWVFRLLQAPGRMTERYLVRGPRLFALLHRARIVLRRRVPVA